MERNERLHHSLPTLDTEVQPIEYRNKTQLKVKKKTKYRNDNDDMTFIISAFYAKFIVILGIALPVTDAVATPDYDTYDAFYMYLYTGSIVFLLYMYMNQMKHKTVQEFWRNSTQSDEMCAEKKSRVRYGSFYFRMGVTGFGIGSVIYSGLQFGQYFELSSQRDCDNVLRAIKPLLRIIFALMQMLFIFSYSNVLFLDIQKSRIIARFGLMHMIATNLCEWFFVLIEETQHDIYKSARKRQDIAARDNISLSEADSEFFNSTTFIITKQLHEHKVNCLQSNLIEPILVKSEPYLAPCTVEYSLLCAVILGVIWRNAKHEGHKSTVESAGVEGKRSGCNVIYSSRQSQFSVDCAQAHKGLFTGILVLAATVMSLIMFFELVGYKHYSDIAILQVNVWESVLFGMGAVASVFCLKALRDLNLRKSRKKLELEHVLLLVTQCGVFMYFLFQIIGGVLMGLNKGKGGIMRIVTPISALLQSSCQTVLVLDAWRRRCSTECQMRLKPGRQLITFLLVANIALWMVNRLKNNRSVSHPNQMDFYGVLAWNIITHVTMPLVVSYRFMSSVCFYEIWKHVYKMSPVSSNKEDRSL